MIVGFPSEIKNFFLNNLDVVQYDESGNVLFVNNHFKTHVLRKLNISNFNNFFSFFSLVKELHKEFQENQSSFRFNESISEYLVRFSFKEFVFYYDALIYHDQIQHTYYFFGSNITEILQTSEIEEAIYKLILDSLQIDIQFTDLKQKLQMILSKLDSLYNFISYGIYTLDIENSFLELLVYKDIPENLIKNFSKIELSRKIQLEDIEDLKDNFLIKKNLPELYFQLNSKGFEFVPLLYQSDFMGIFFYKFSESNRSSYILQFIPIIFINIIYKKILFDSINFEFKKVSETNDKLVQILEENLTLRNLIYRYTPRKTFLKVQDSLTKNLMIPNEKHFYYFLFLDIVDFTKFSEGKDPEFVIESLNSYFSHLVDIIYDNQGDIDKFMGDNIFAFFESADEALQTALEILHYFKNHISKDFMPFKAKIALHCGDAIHGNLGNRFRSEFTLIGDAVNTTSRLQKIGRPNQIVVSEDFIMNLSNKKVALSNKFYLRVKGKLHPIAIYFVLDEFHRSAII
ncbi:MAG: adenylate/guanylate cyclase domain-containing protein [Leptonema sp. (in: bacteria)]